MTVMVVVEAHCLIMECVQKVATFVTVDRVHRVIVAGMEIIKSQNPIYTENLCLLHHQKLMTRMMTITVQEIATEITEFWRNIIRSTSSQLLV